jgi:glycosyltransferase involved in cell wall biosynthesis
MKKILVFGMTPLHGGVETFLINYYQHMDHQKLHFDFLCNFSVPIAFEEELRRDGCRIYHITPKKESYFRYQKELHAFFKEHGREYDVFWQNVNELANIEYLVLARKYGIPKRIIHSHSSKSSGGIRQRVSHRVNRARVDRFATDFWACSASAADWFYRKKLLPDVVVINNAIDLRKNKFNFEAREKLREQYCCENQYVIGNVGRLTKVKNQAFLLDIIRSLVNKNINARLFLVGEGEDKEKLEQKVKLLNLEERVSFVGVQRDVPSWLSCFDLFLFPSMFEGLSIAAMEAQANGVPVLASESVIPPKVRINENFHFFSLERSADEWAERIIQIKNEDMRMDEQHIQRSFQKAGFDIETAAQKVQNLLLK